MFIRQPEKNQFSQDLVQILLLSDSAADMCDGPHLADHDIAVFACQSVQSHKNKFIFIFS